jgi:hypothetical protein
MKYYDQIMQDLNRLIDTSGNLSKQTNSLIKLRSILQEAVLFDAVNVKKYCEASIINPEKFDDYVYKMHLMTSPTNIIYLDIGNEINKLYHNIEDNNIPEYIDFKVGALLHYKEIIINDYINDRSLYDFLIKLKCKWGLEITYFVTAIDTRTNDESSTAVFASRTVVTDEGKINLNYDIITNKFLYKTEIKKLNSILIDFFPESSVAILNYIKMKNCKSDFINSFINIIAGMDYIENAEDFNVIFIIRLIIYMSITFINHENTLITKNSESLNTYNLITIKPLEIKYH